MYVITRNGAWWDESASPNSATRQVASAQALEEIRRLLCPQAASEGCVTRWAARPLMVSRGKCLALRFEGGAEPQVLLQQQRKPRQWLPLSQVLDEAQTRRWVEQGFVRQA